MKLKESAKIDLREKLYERIARTLEARPISREETL